MSLRHNAYLDAARESILDLGLKGSTLTDVARRAGVSRMTIYRRWPDASSLLRDLMTREWTELAATLPTTEAAPTADELASGVAAMVSALRSNALFARILDVDPDVIVPYLFDRRGRSQQAVLDLLTPLVIGAQEAGHVRSGDPETIARTVVLAAHGLTLSTHTMADDTVSEADLLAEFTALLAAGLSA